MSWTQSYTHTLALALDRAGAAVFFNRADITISSLCWIARVGSGAVAEPNPTLKEIAQAAYKSAKLNWWQTKALLGIGFCLESTFPGHCAAARKSDIATLNSGLALLGAGLAP